MSIYRSFTRRLLPGAFLACLAVKGQANAHAEILALDWSHLSGAYQSGAANATTTQTFTVGSMTASTVFGDDTTHFITNTPIVGTYGGTAAAGPPAVNPLYLNGGTDQQLAMQIGVDLTDSTTQDVKFTINFSQAVYGATFTLFDVDANSSSYVDQVRNILGVNGADTVLPTLTSSVDNLAYPGNGITSSDPTILNAVTGTASAAQNTGNGNVRITFDSNTPITSISFLYGDNHSLTGAGLASAPTNSGTQIVGLSNIAWSTEAGVAVPEPGMFATLGFGLTGLASVVLRRRRQD